MKFFVAKVSLDRSLYLPVLLPNSTHGISYIACSARKPWPRYDLQRTWKILGYDKFSSARFKLGTPRPLQRKLTNASKGIWISVTLFWNQTCDPTVNSVRSCHLATVFVDSCQLDQEYVLLPCYLYLIYGNHAVRYIGLVWWCRIWHQTRNAVNHCVNWVHGYTDNGWNYTLSMTLQKLSQKNSQYEFPCIISLDCVSGNGQRHETDIA